MSKITIPLLALALGLPAQELPETVLQRAKTLHELEHDAAGAAELYRRVAADASVSAATRSRAWLDLAEVERSLGNVDAAKAALTKAAEGEGEAAAEATRRLQDPAATRSDVELQILRAIQDLRTSSSAEELVFFGERALPLLFRSIESETGDLEFVRRGAHVVWRVGGERARAWLTNDVPRLDALRRRAVVHGVPGASLSAAKPAAGMEASFATFFADPDPGVRLEACEAFDRFPLSRELESFVDLLLDPDVRVATAAARQLSKDSQATLSYGPPRWLALTLVKILEARAAGTVPAEALENLASIPARTSGIWADPSTRTSLLRLVEAFPEVRMPRVPEMSDLRLLRGFEPFEPDELAPEIRDLVRSLGERPLEDQRTFDDANQVVGLLAELYEHWTHDSMPVVLELARRGLGGMDAWLSEHATAEDWLTIASEPSRYEAGLVGFAAQGLGAAGLPAEPAAGLQAWFDRAVASPSTGDSRSATFAMFEIAFTLAETPFQDTVAWAERHIRAGSSRLPAWRNSESPAQLRWELFAGLTRRGDAERVAAVRRIALDPGVTDRALRNHAVGWLIHQAVDDPIELLLAARELGFAGLAAGGDHGVVGRRMPEMRANVNGHPIGVEWLLVEGLPGYDAERLDAIVRELLRQGDERMWLAEIGRNPPVGDTVRRRRVMALIEHCPYAGDLNGYLRELRNGISPGRSGPRIEVPEGALLARFLVGVVSLGDNSAVNDLTQICRVVHERGSLPEEVRSVLREFARSDDGYVAQLGLYGVDSLGAAEDPVPLLRQVYADPKSPVRASALAILFGRVEQTEKVELLVAALNDPGIRFTAADLAHNVFDERLIEPLLACLRDRSEDTRKQAQQALDAQRAWLEEEARWARLRADTRLDATSAADALLTQAAADQPKPIRLAAIRSLGTLALPETLPLLIEMLRDQDREITVAASAAIERINREQDD